MTSPGSKESGGEHLSASAHAAIAQRSYEQGNLEFAKRHALIAADLDSGPKPTDLDLAVIFHACGEADRARGIVERLFRSGERSPRFAVLFGEMAPSMDRINEALSLLVELIGAMKGQPAREMAIMHAVVANLLDRVGEYDRAFAYATQSNVLRGGTYERERVERFVSQMTGYFTRHRMSSLARSTLQTEQPVFLIGMPRSGSTLIEQILSSHPKVAGGGEVPWMFDAGFESARRAGGNTEFPDSLDRLTISDVDAMAAQYLAKISSVAPGMDRFTDKMLSNYLNLGLIALLFPQAKVIHCVRDPLDTCLSCYMTNFATGHEFTRRLDWLGHFYSNYRRLMGHWFTVLDQPILGVRYEALVQDPQAQSRRIFDFLGLGWDERCLRFYENKRPITTSSAQQVRRPIYSSSVGRWRHYEKQLMPLRRELERG